MWVATGADGQIAGVVAPAPGDAPGALDLNKLTLRIDFDADRAIGPGKVKLLEMIDKHGSISEAGRQMGMSYRRAWLLVDSLNRSFNVPVIASQKGGHECAIAPPAVK